MIVTGNSFESKPRYETRTAWLPAGKLLNQKFPSRSVAVSISVPTIRTNAPDSAD